MTGNALIKELSISKADLVRACLNIGLPVFGVDVLRREFSTNEINRVKRSVGSASQATQARSEKLKKKPKSKQAILKTPRFFADEFQVDIEIVFSLAKSFGFVIRNENHRLTDRQIAVLEEQLIARENPAIVELQHENVEILGNSGFALALKRALELRGPSIVADPKKSRNEAFVATSKRLKLVAKENGVSEELLKELCAAVGIPVIPGKKSLKIDVQHLDEVAKTIVALNEVQQYRSTEEKVRVSKIAKTFSVQAKVVRELCEANGVQVISERFIANSSEVIILVLLQLRSYAGGEAIEADLSSASEKQMPSKVELVDYSGLSLTRQSVHEYDFSKSIMNEVDFSYSKLSALNFKRSQLQKSAFIQVNIESSTFCSSNLDSALFDFVVADKIDFKNANLANASFRKAKLKNCSFAGSDLSHCNFEDAKIENCDFSGAVFVDTKWIDGQIVQSCDDVGRYGTK